VHFSILESSELLEKFDELILSSLQTVTNIQISSSAWAQSILPTAKEGLGTCSADLSLPCYLSSIHSTSELVSSIFLPSGLATDFSLRLEALVCCVSYATRGPQTSTTRLG